MGKITVTGIVAEYNPFHAGHKYQVDKLREMGAKEIVAVMSGNFVQRCEPAFFPKHPRAEAAIRGGVDLVIELPVRFATASAEKFAFGAVYLLNMCGVCDSICFGSESGDISALKDCAEKVLSADANGEIARAVRGGESFARARQRVVGSDLLSEPNNILAVEYLKALKRLDSDIEPITLKRTFGYHDSATKLRKNIRNGNYEGLPATTEEIIHREEKRGRLPADAEEFGKLLLAFLRNAEPKDFEGIYGVNTREGFGNRLLGGRFASDINEAVELIKTKKYAESTVKRGLLSAYLRLPDDGTLPNYVRPLAFNEKGRELLKKIKTKTAVVNNLADLTDETGMIFADEERRATDLFGLTLPTVQRGMNEFTEKNIPFIQ